MNSFRRLQEFKKPRSIEDLKERYYGIIEKLEIIHPDPSKVGTKPFHYDAGDKNASGS
jgi:hypothetical protein